MSVLIKGMEIPKNCDNCPLNYDSIDCMVANNALRENGGGDFLFDHERHPNCPLIPVPSHGRLIDADALKVSLAFAEEIARWAVPALRAVMMVIDEIPTIIPAEEGVR